MPDDLLAALRGHLGRRYGPVHAWDRVNEPMIRHWCEAMGADPAPYLAADPAGANGGPFAPATMLPVWLMSGLLRRVPPGSDARDNREIFRDLEAAGYLGILGTNCEQEYARPLRPGERLSSTYEVEAVSEEKRTRFGPGFFVTFLQRFHVEDGEEVGAMRLRILRFRPEERVVERVAERAAPRPAPPQPAISADTRFFWEGLKAGKLLIQRCVACGRLQHPPGPACPHCHGLELDAVEASGRGEIYSFVVVHHPLHPAFDTPHPVGLIALEEGVRLVAPLIAPDPAALAIGTPVEVVFDTVAGAAAEGDRLPHFRPVAAG